MNISSIEAFSAETVFGTKKYIAEINNVKKVRLTLTITRQLFQIKTK